MKTNYLILAALLLAFLSSQAQDGKPGVALNVGIGNSYNLTARKGAIKDYHSIEGDVNFVFNGKWTVGYAQSGSVFPSNFVKGTPSLKKAKIHNYTLGVGRILSIDDRWYFVGQASFGISRFNTATSYASDWDEIRDRGGRTSWLAGAKASVGFNINKFLALEAGVDYRRYFEKDQLVIPTSDLNSLGVGLSLIGKLNLTK